MGTGTYHVEGWRLENIWLCNTVRVDFRVAHAEIPCTTLLQLVLCHKTAFVVHVYEGHVGLHGQSDMHVRVFVRIGSVHTPSWQLHPHDFLQKHGPVVA